MVKIIVDIQGFIIGIGKESGIVQCLVLCHSNILKWVILAKEINEMNIFFYYYY